MTFDAITKVGLLVVVGFAIYAHLLYRSRKLRGVLRHPARNAAQRWSRRALVIGAGVAAVGLLLPTTASSHVTYWPYPTGLTMMVVGILTAFAGAFMVGYTSDGPPNER